MIIPNYTIFLLIPNVPSNLNHISTPVEGILWAGMVILPRKSSYKDKVNGYKQCNVNYDKTLLYIGKYIFPSQ